MKLGGTPKPKQPLTPRDQKEFERFIRRYGRPFIIHLAKTLPAEPGKGGRKGTGLERKGIAYFLWTYTKMHKADHGPRGARDRAFRDLYKLVKGREATDDLELYGRWKKTMVRRVQPYLTKYERQFEAEKRGQAVNPRHIVGMRSRKK